MSRERTVKFARQNTSEDKEYRELIQMVFDSSTSEPRGRKDNIGLRDTNDEYAESIQKDVNSSLSELEATKDVAISCSRRISDTLAISEELAQTLFKNGPFYISSPMKEILKNANRSWPSAKSTADPSPVSTETKGNASRDSFVFLRRKIESVETIVGQACTDILELKRITSSQVVESCNDCSADDERSAEEFRNDDFDTLKRRVVNIRKTMEQAQTDLNELERIISAPSSGKSTNAKLKRHWPTRKE